jgi:O-antigen ligase
MMVVLLAIICVAGFYGVNSWILTQEITTVSKQGGWQEQIKSIANLRSDVSNLERINRYRCAWRMFLDRPFFGFGPGTFAQAYLPYQKPEEMTRLSVTSTRASDGKAHPSGHGGGAHSEYFQALAELGLMGLVLWVSLLGATIFTGAQKYFKNSFKNERWFVLGLTIGIISYTILAAFNNFLHSEKISILFWVSLASLTIGPHLGKKE